MQHYTIISAIKNKNKAVGLIEILLVLILIAAIAVLATRYYANATQAQKIQDAIDQVNAVRGAMQNSVVGQTLNQAGTPSIGDLVREGFLPPSAVGFSSLSTAENDGINPWGLNIKVVHDPGLLFVVRTVVPNGAICADMQTKLQATAAAPQVVRCSMSDASGDDNSCPPDNKSVCTLNARYPF